MELSCNYDKNTGFLIFGILELFLAALLSTPFAIYPRCLNLQWFYWWWPLYVFPIFFSIVFLFLGLSKVLFWTNRIRKKPYLTVQDGVLNIDAETSFALSDICAVRLQKFLGARILCLKIASPEKYDLSWRFKLDRLFHKNYSGFICIDMIERNKQQECLNLFLHFFPVE